MVWVGKDLGDSVFPPLGTGRSTIISMSRPSSRAGCKPPPARPGSIPAGSRGCSHPREAGADTHGDSCSWCTTPCTARRGRRPRRRWSPRTASCCCTTCTRSCRWCTPRRRRAARRAAGTAWRCGWLWGRTTLT